jgi:crescentin
VAAPSAPIAPPQIQVQPDEVADDVSHEIGARYETVSQRIEDAIDIFDQIQPLAQVIAQIREAVQAEFQERRAEHGELLGLRANIEQSRTRLEQADQLNRETQGRLARTEAELFETQARAEADRRKLEATLADEQQVRADLTHTQARAGQLEDALKNALDSVSQLSEDREALRDQLSVSEERRREADAASGRNHQSALMAQEELAVMRKQLDATNADVTRQNRQVAELDSLLGSERARARGLEASLASTQEESLRSNRAIEARLEAARAELTVANGKLESYLAQTAKLEGLNAEAALRLNDALAGQRGSERQLAELQIDFGRAEERIRALDEELAAMRVRLATVESARTAAVERSDQLSKQLQTTEIALKRGETRAAELRERLEAAQAENAHRRSTMEERLANLEAGLERERAERTIAEGALESLRRERGRMSADQAANEPGLAAHG